MKPVVSVGGASGIAGAVPSSTGLDESVGPSPAQAAPVAVAMAIAAAVNMRLAFIGSLPFHASAGARAFPAGVGDNGLHLACLK